jgi:hypothetical protein
MHSRLLVGLLILAASTCATAQTQPSTRPAPANETDFQTALKSAKPGDIVLTPFLDAAVIPAVPITIAPAADSPQFLLSDRPEYFRTGDGISMQEDVQPGVVRLYVYHVPEPTGAKKVITAVVENLSPTDTAAVRFRKACFAKPGGDYHNIARKVMADYLGDEAHGLDHHFDLKPGERRPIDPALEAVQVTKDQLVHGIYEFACDRPLRVTVLQRDPSARSEEVVDTLPKLPRILPGWHASGAGRGYFTTCEYNVTSKDDAVIDTTGGVQRVLVADGKTDPWIVGRDSLDTSEPSPNKGNYGVMYRMKFRFRSTDGRGLALVMVGYRPDTQFCKHTAAVISINDGKERGGVIALPAKEKRFENLPSGCVMQIYEPPPAGETREIELTYSPPGACCLPTPILLVPVD